MSPDQVCVVVGASHAGSQLAVHLRKQGWKGRILLIGAENTLPYHRPPLSKAVLAGEKQVEDGLLRPRAMYEKNSIELRLGETVSSIDVKGKRVQLLNAQELAYDKLALCLGSMVRKIPLGQALEGVFYLRDANDVLSILARVGEKKKVVIIGAGYIGLEAAAALSRSGLEVTVLEMEDRVLKRVTSELMSTFIQDLHQSHGVTVRTNVVVASIEGEREVSSVLCADGSNYAADLVLIGVGIVPNIALAEQAGLAIDNGLVVDQHAQTSDQHIYGAGDCTDHPSTLYQRNLRLESVQNANDQARVAASNICGIDTVYDALPWFWSDQFDIKLQIAGLNTGYDTTLVRGELGGADGFVIFYFKDHRLIAADCVNRPKEFMVCKRIIKEGIVVATEKLLDESLQPRQFLE